MSRRFRVETFDKVRKGHVPDQTHSSKHLDYILSELHTLRTQPSQNAPSPANQSIDSAIAVWSGVEDIQRRLDITKTEIGALKDRGVVTDGEASRTTDELRAVVTGTEEATDAILAAAETIDTIAQRLMTSDDEAAKSDGQLIGDAVIQIFEACNFQDITGQRITKVVDSLQFIEERIASMIDVWQTLQVASGRPPAEEQSPKQAGDERLLNGPALKNDVGVVNQDDVDALFR